MIETLEMTQAEKTRLALITLEIQRRRKINPLEFFERLPIHEKFRLDPAKIKFIFGGNRSGKSEGCAEYVVNKPKVEGRPLKIWVCGETFQDSIAIQQKKIWNLIPKDQIQYGRYDEINGFTNRKLLMKDGTLYVFKSYDQGREAFQSDDIDVIWNDEEPPLDIVREQRMRLIDRNGEMIISMTSLKGMTELVADMFEDYEQIEGQYCTEVKEMLPRIAVKNGVKFYFLWTTENPYINQDRLKEEMKLMPKSERMSRIFGIPTNLSGKIYMSFNRLVHSIALEDIPTSGNQLWNVLDPHDRKPWAIGWFLVNRNGTLYMVDEYPNRNFNEMLFDDKTYADYAKIIKKKESALREMFGCDKVKRIIDPNFGNKTMQLAERQGGQSKTTPRTELAKLGLNYSDGIDALEAGHLKVRALIDWKKRPTGELTKWPGIYFGEWLENTIRHMSRYSRKQVTAGDGDEKDKVGPQEKFKDFCDLVRYFAMANPRWIEVKTFKPNNPKAY